MSTSLFQMESEIKKMSYGDIVLSKTIRRKKKCDSQGNKQATIKGKRAVSIAIVQNLAETKRDFFVFFILLDADRNDRLCVVFFYTENKMHTQMACRQVFPFHFR